MPNRVRNRSDVRNFEEVLQNKILFTVARRSRTSDKLFVSGDRLIGRAYTVGGFNTASAQTTINRFYFEDETFVVSSGALTQSRTAAHGGGGKWKGYVSGGYSNNSAAHGYTSIESLRFADDAVATLSATPTGSRIMAAYFSSPFACFFGGGYDNSPTTYYDNIDKLRFSDETLALLSATLSQLRLGSAAVQNEFFGWTLGGQVAGVQDDTIDKFRYSDDTLTTPAATLVATRSRQGALSSRTIGYSLGGGLTLSAEIDGVKFDTDTQANPSATLANARMVTTCNTQNTIKGYLLGGYVGGAYVDTCEGFDFTTESVFSVSATIPNQVLGGQVGITCLY